ncbi:MAG: hypothetical protein KIS78_13455 [Labilithrix sp.]|nr:hypothetical protein [Labilithrix sp.]MCW5833403.1 hypothetical protein [Labilithrix sp.]
MKGNAYRGLVEQIVRTVPGGVDAVSAHLSAATRSFFAQNLMAGGWYDVVPVEELTRVASRLSGQPHELFCQRAARAILERDSNGIYRAILRLATADLVVRALPYTTNRYFDFVKLDVQCLEKRRYRVTVSGVPRAVVQSYIPMTTVFIAGAIERAGGRDVETIVSAPRFHAVVRGHPVMQFQRDIRWHD